MELTICVNTCGEKCSFEFCAGFEIDYVRFTRLNTDQIDDAEADFEDICYTDIENPEGLDWDYIRSMDHGTLEEAFWEAMNDNPEWEIIPLLEALPEYPKFREMPTSELEDFVYDFVSKALVSSEITYEIDGEDVTDKVGSSKGKWDDQIFSQITSSVMYQFKKRFA